MNFLEDYIEKIEGELVAEGVSFDKISNADDTLVFISKYCSYLYRQIQSAKRTVLCSHTLLTSDSYNKHLAAVNKLASLAESGSDLKPYQSRSLKCFKYSEFLLFDWGVHHLHLGLHLTGKAFCEPTGPLLFAIFRPEKAYFIAILKHGDWAEIDLLNIVDKEWPELLDPFVAVGAIDIRPMPTPEETLDLRKAGISVSQKLTSGKIIASPGGGITSACTSVAAMREAQHIVRILRDIESRVKENEADMRAKLGAQPDERIHLASISFSDREATLKTDRCHSPLVLSWS